MDSGDLTFYIWTVSACNRSNKSTPATINIHPRKSRGEEQRAEKRTDLCVLRHYFHVTLLPLHCTAELVKDFKCYVYYKKMNCSWIPVRQDANLTLSFRWALQQQPKLSTHTVYVLWYVHSGFSGRCWNIMSGRWSVSSMDIYWQWWELQDQRLVAGQWGQSWQANWRISGFVFI